MEKNTLNSHFHFLVHSGGHEKWRSEFNDGLEFIKSLGLNEEQYKKLGSLIERYEDFVRERIESDRLDNEYFNQFRE